MIREEAVIPPQGITAFPTVADGQAVAAGAQIARSGNTGIFAPAAGIYTHSTDGYEHLSQEDVSILSVQDADRLLQIQPIHTPNFGKIVTDHSWLLVAVTDTALPHSIQAKDRIILTAVGSKDFTLTATVVQVIQSEQNRCAVVFRCVDHLSDTLSLRHLTVSLPLGQIEGLRIPTKAIYTDETGSYVYIRSAAHAKKIYVNILFVENNDTIVAAGNSADTLQVGDIIILSRTELQDGMLMK